jgi:hypothetical protein
MNNPNGTTQIPMDKITSSKRNFENCTEKTVTIITKEIISRQTEF